MENERLLSISELAKATGTTPRTVHYYVQRKLIDPPVGLGRASGYTSKHVEQIAKVVSLQREGLLLDEIARIRSDPASARTESRVKAGFEPNLSKISFWIPVSEGVSIRVEVGAQFPGTDAVAEAYRRFLETIGKQGDENGR